MQKDTAGYSLDALRVNEEEVRTPTLFPVSIMTCKTEFVQPVTNVVALKNSLNAKILEKYAFQKTERKKFKRAFLNSQVAQIIFSTVFLRKKHRQK